MLLLLMSCKNRYLKKNNNLEKLKYYFFYINEGVRQLFCYVNCIFFYIIN